MTTTNSFLGFIERSVKQNWDLEALTDYKGQTLRYRDVAKGIAELHLLFREAGIKKGDKIALCGRNSSNWGMVFLATLTYGTVAVPILHDFKADNIQNIVNHSDSVMLFVGDNVWENLDEQQMKALKGIFSVNSLAMLISRDSKLTKAKNNLGKLFRKAYPKGLSASMIKYHEDMPDELAYISYTSGTTSFSKGVMLPYRSLWSNMQFAHDNMGLQPGDRHVCMLPLAHAFGLMFEFLFEFTKGCHTYFLTRMPSPKIIFQAYREVRPNLIITVPLVIEKVIKKNVMPKLETPKMRMALRVPIVKDRILASIRRKIIDLFGGDFIELIVGGAPLNEEVERFLRKIKFPYTIGYGMTECGPLICYASAATFKQASCGRPVDRLEVKIDSTDPQNVPGEILVRGDNVTLGYYKSQQSTDNAFTDEGWFRTGDMALMDKERNISIKGRCKTMILGPSGQNIYPEEIEEKLNNLPYVAECLAVEKGGKIIALIHPDYNEAMTAGLSNDDIVKQMEENRRTLNGILPKYSQVAAVKIYPEEFEKTPKRSIKRYLYQ